ncbi:MAG: prepilin-type N-terminal cleavage/methylation domain-containing protein [Oligoflexia bacterium]|nr:prepilin-type N-terminal cleavage/methylation domain-containing protein [Oligoflexia bacterium]
MSLKNKGFSLIELLAAVAILSILTAISTVFYRSYVGKANLGLVETVLRSAYSLVKDNQNFGITTTNTELNNLSTPKKQYVKAKLTDPSTTIGTWTIILKTGSSAGATDTKIPIDQVAGLNKKWCLQISLGDIAYKDAPSCIDSSGDISHKTEPLPSSRGECGSASAQCE